MSECTRASASVNYLDIATIVSIPMALLCDHCFLGCIPYQWPGHAELVNIYMPSISFAVAPLGCQWASRFLWVEPDVAANRMLRHLQVRLRSWYGSQLAMPLRRLSWDDLVHCPTDSHCIHNSWGWFGPYTWAQKRESRENRLGLKQLNLRVSCQNGPICHA